MLISVIEEGCVLISLKKFQEYMDEWEGLTDEEREEKEDEEYMREIRPKMEAIGAKPVPPLTEEEARKTRKEKMN